METVNSLLNRKGVEAFQFFGFGSVEPEGDVYVTPDKFQAYMNVTRSLSSPEDYARFEDFVDGYLGKLNIKELQKEKPKGTIRVSPTKVLSPKPTNIISPNPTKKLTKKEERKERREDRKEDRKERREERKEERKESKHKGLTIGKQILQTMNKVNPVTIAVRNALRALIALNFLGMASAINAKPELRKKVENMYKNMGGKIDSLSSSVKTGAGKKPLFNKDAEKYNGLGSVTVASLLTGAGAFVLKIWSWMKEVGIKAVKVIKDNKDIIKDKIEDIVGKKDKGQSSTETESDTESESGSDSGGDTEVMNAQNENEPKKSNIKKIVFIGLGIVAIGGLGYLAYSKLSNKKEYNSEALKGLKPLGHVKLN